MHYLLIIIFFNSPLKFNEKILKTFFKLYLKSNLTKLFDRSEP
jgi:hypothetical protein